METSLKVANVNFEYQEWVVAVHDYVPASVESGDLSFEIGDKIKILLKTDQTDDWWEGELNGVSGWFPANYVEEDTDTPGAAKNIRFTMHGDEKWERDALLGEGTFGKVWSERETNRREKVRAVKEIKKSLLLGTIDYHKELASMTTIVEKFSLYFVTLLNWYETDYTLFLAMELCPYGNLYGNLSAIKDEEDVRPIAKQSLEALNYLHMAGMIHGDIKIQNILVLEKGPKWHVKMSDFRFARKLCLRNAQPSMALDQAPEIESSTDPERARYSSKVDMYFLGTIFFVLGSALDTDDETATEDVANSESPVKTQYSMDTLRKGKLSLNLLTVIQSLLESDVNRRWTAKRALNAPWFGSSTSTTEVAKRLGDTLSVEGSSAMVRSHSAPPLPPRRETASKVLPQAMEVMKSDSQQSDAGGQESPRTSQLDTVAKNIESRTSSTGVTINLSNLPLDDELNQVCAVCDENDNLERGGSMYICTVCNTSMHEKCARNLVSDDTSEHEADHQLVKCLPSFTVAVDDFIAELDIPNSSVSGLSSSFTNDTYFQTGPGLANQVIIRLNPPPGSYRVQFTLVIEPTISNQRLGIRQNWKLGLRGGELGTMRLALQTNNGRNTQTIESDTNSITDDIQRTLELEFEAPAMVNTKQWLEMVIETAYDVKLFKNGGPFRWSISEIFLFQYGPLTHLATRQELQKIKVIREEERQFEHQETLRDLEIQNIQQRAAADAKAVKRGTYAAFGAAVAAGILKGAAQSRAAQRQSRIDYDDL